jgi:dihydrofolate synthase / folylpolyglutamate synthase
MADRPPDDILEYLFGLEKLGIKFGLDNIRALCDALGHPESAWPSAIIAGTNGKGSVAAMVEAGLRAAGLKTGLYTSPHLVRLEERFALDGTPVQDADLRRAATRVQGATAELRASHRLDTEPTFFEATTAIAFEIFRSAGVGFTVLEVGLGGRFDATNVASPVAAAITTIDFDHERFLGNTIRAIAGEKAGVIKPGMRVVVGERKPDAVEVFEAACRERGASLVRAHDGIVSAVEIEGGRLVLRLRTPVRTYPPMPLALRGRHQVDNAIVAIRLLEELAAAGYPAGEDAIVQATTAARWPGRLDLRSTARGQVLLDAAHNPAGAAVLAAYLREFHPGRLPIVFGIMKDKDVVGTLGPLLPVAAPLVLTRPHTERALTPDALRQAARHLGGGVDLHVEPDPRAALELAWSFAPFVCVAGSIFLVGDLVAGL